MINGYFSCMPTQASSVDVETSRASVGLQVALMISDERCGYSCGGRRGLLWERTHHQDALVYGALANAHSNQTPMKCTEHDELCAARKPLGYIDC